MNHSAAQRNHVFAIPAESPANAVQGLRWSRALLALTMIGLGTIGFIHADFALVWQRVPIEQLPGRQFLAYLCAAIELATGIGLLVARAVRLSACALALFLLLWVVLLKLPAVLAVPTMEATWLGLGEIAVIFAGGWILCATEGGRHRGSIPKFAAGATGIRYARLVFALSLPMIGLSHFFYSEQTAAFVPAWLPWKLGWAYLTGTGSLVACVALLLGVLPRLAATLEAAMLTVITLLVWGPGLFALPPDRTQWTGFFISLAIAAGAWVVADSYGDVSWFSLHAASSRAEPARQ
jgi:uncharacterized membrane protein YphA (DoxX/SURF4 family)